MTLTIEVDGPLASQLQATAADRQVTPQEFARSLLCDALQDLNACHEWESQNQRRIALIKKSVTQPLAQAEADELQALQEAADQRLEERDRQLLDGLNQFKQAVNNLPADAQTD